MTSARPQLISGLVLAAALGYVWWSAAPARFPLAEAVTIGAGADVATISQQLKSAGVIRSPSLLQLWLRLLDTTGRGALAGDYVFEQKLLVSEVARRLATGLFSVDPVKVTLPEGLTVREMAAVLADILPNFSVDQFVALAAPLEGRLFPDTYFWSRSANADLVLRQLTGNFDRQIVGLENLVRASQRSLDEVLIMASLLEEEAHRPEHRRQIAGILWKRYDAGMPLQVDAVFPYLIGKNSLELTVEDLEIDSPYNTYRYAGLPPRPITNPGLDSIMAALEPAENDYWYYLSDEFGELHYAETFDEHRANKSKYL